MGSSENRSPWAPTFPLPIPAPKGVKGLQVLLVMTGKPLDVNLQAPNLVVLLVKKEEPLDAEEAETS